MEFTLVLSFQESLGPGPLFGAGPMSLTRGVLATGLTLTRVFGALSDFPMLEPEELEASEAALEILVFAGRPAPSELVAETLRRATVSIMVGRAGGGRGVETCISLLAKLTLCL